MSNKRTKITIDPHIVVTIDVDTTPEEVLAAAARAEKLLLSGIKNRKGIPPLKHTLLLFAQLIKSALVGELCFDIEEEELAEILEVVLDTPGYTFSKDFPYTKEQILADTIEESSYE